MPEEMQFKKPGFKKISDVMWDIPPDFKPGMRVPARIIATRKNIGDVVEATALAGISLPVAKLVPFGNIKG